VPRSWQLLTDDPAERATFSDLASTLALEAEPAGPPNRLRQVSCIKTLERRYFLKSFTQTQWKNRVHFATSSPRAVDDADRERRVTDALRRAGYGAPRPVAYGRDGAASYYLCAALPGSSLAALLSGGGLAQALAVEAARHCGLLLAEGFRLPDLSADHVFLDQDGGLHVLDLHNGGIARPGAPPRRLLKRVLRRFGRSAQGLPITQVTAMRFATRLLRTAGTSARQRRALLDSAEPLAPSGP